MKPTDNNFQIMKADKGNTAQPVAKMEDDEEVVATLEQQPNKLLYISDVPTEVTQEVLTVLFQQVSSSATNHPHITLCLYEHPWLEPWVLKGNDAITHGLLLKIYIFTLLELFY